MDQRPASGLDEWQESAQQQTDDKKANWLADFDTTRRGQQANIGEAI